MPSLTVETPKEIDPKSILRILLNESAISREGFSNTDSRVPAELIFAKLCKDKDVQCSVIMFVKILNCIKEKYPKAYKKIDIPKQWNGKSHIFFPEAYPSADRLLCLVKKRVQAQLIYPEIDDDRYWNLDERVWVPMDHPLVITWLETKWLEML